MKRRASLFFPKFLKIANFLIKSSWLAQPFHLKPECLFIHFNELSYRFPLYRSSHRRYSIKKVLLKISQNLQENTCTRVSFLSKVQPSACNFIKKTLAQLFSCEFSFFTEHLRPTASNYSSRDNVD